jgi:hypothetical protein
MKKLLFIALTFVLASCGADVTKVKPGMKAAEVEQLIGKPDDVGEMPPAGQLWKYGENQMVVIQGDTVANVVPDVQKYLEEKGAPAN